ncbi:(2Fe-2S)-binding protein [Mesorhizobium sp. BAC0120]|uniref:(2Fe-2S)-binding protein n=1 Tax=Mesorhizobium sp. BAC0120 TaxID=3090670 RepID=UPI00298C38D1|nr:(2Fe-2S)-binding protein [Mesorhizobium sp. BAC0120]MDW6023188.1 (2Fe-2S)-binding protein [Mesorhizobium sp. BAC0120]
MKTAIAFTLNRKACTVDVAATDRLIDVLRERLATTASKKACGIGRCGACMVLMNGLPTNACLLMMWQVDGAEIITSEGLVEDAEAAYVRQGLIEENAFQCGYCAPGFTVTLTALLSATKAPTEAEIRMALEGNLCRCTGYHSIVRGALRAVELKGQAAAASK